MSSDTRTDWYHYIYIYIYLYLCNNDAECFSFTVLMYTSQALRPWQEHIAQLFQEGLWKVNFREGERRPVSQGSSLKMLLFEELP